MFLMHEENILLLHITRIRGKSCINIRRYLRRIINHYHYLNINTDLSFTFWFFWGREQARQNWRGYRQPKPYYDLKLLYFPFQLTSCMFLKTHDNFIDVWCVEKVRKLGAKYRSLPVKKWSTVKITWTTCFKRKQLIFNLSLQRFLINYL